MEAVRPAISAIYINLYSPHCDPYSSPLFKGQLEGYESRHLYSINMAILAIYPKGGRSSSRAIGRCSTERCGLIFMARAASWTTVSMMSHCRGASLPTKKRRDTLMVGSALGAPSDSSDDEAESATELVPSGPEASPSTLVVVGGVGTVVAARARGGGASRARLAAGSG